MTESQPFEGWCGLATLKALGSDHTYCLKRRGNEPAARMGREEVLRNRYCTVSYVGGRPLGRLAKKGGRRPGERQAIRPFATMHWHL